MDKSKLKILVAGAGHGGIATAAILAKEGFNVTVFERNAENDMGYDWTDVFDCNGFTAAGFPLPCTDKFSYKKDMTFFGPSGRTRKRQHVPVEQLEIQMERRDIYDLLISHAKESGVKFVFDTPVTAPVLLGNRVVGIKTDNEEILGDLVIDAAGLDSPLRSMLPPSFGIQNHTEQYEKFYVYRAFFEKTGIPAEEKYKVVIFNGGKLSICWIAEEEAYTDVLIGQFTPLTSDDVTPVLERLRAENPVLGEKRLRGGQFVTIPVRQPLAVLVANGYAAIGDSAFMTVPIIGSGIANSLKAARILADAVIADSSGAFSAYTLWKYQREFYRKLGAGLAPIASVKLMLTRLGADDVDYLFDNNIIDEDLMTIGADTNSFLKMSSGLKPITLKDKAPAVFKNPKLLKEITKMGADIGRAAAVTAAMPIVYEPTAVRKWAKAYNNCFK